MVVPSCFPSFSFSFKFIRITAIQNNNSKRNEIKNGAPGGQQGRPGRPRPSSKPKPDNPKPKPDRTKTKPNQPKPKPNQPKPDKLKHNSSVGKPKSKK